MSHLRILGNGESEPGYRPDFFNDTPSLPTPDSWFTVLGRGESSARQVAELVTTNWEEYNYYAGLPDAEVDEVLANNAQKHDGSSDHSSDQEKARAQDLVDYILKQRDLRDNGDPDVAWYMSSMIEIETVTYHEEQAVVPSRWSVGIPRDSSTDDGIKFDFKLEPAIIGQPTKYPMPIHTAQVSLDFTEIVPTETTTRGRLDYFGNPTSVTEVGHYRYGYNDMDSVANLGMYKGSNRHVETEGGRIAAIVGGKGRYLDPALHFEYARRYHNILACLVRSLDKTA